MFLMTSLSLSERFTKYDLDGFLQEHVPQLLHSPNYALNFEEFQFKSGVIEYLSKSPDSTLDMEESNKSITDLQECKELEGFELKYSSSVEGMLLLSWF